MADTLTAPPPSAAPAVNAPPSGDGEPARIETPAGDGESGVAGETVIEIRNLSKVYRDFWGRKKVRALNSLSLDVKRGEVFGLLGPNGSGKTTTLKMLLGLLFPTEGSIRIFGRPATDVEKNERIGYLPEESYLYRFLNAEETLDFYGRLFRMDRKTRRAKTDELLKLVKIEHARKRQLKEYSKGMTRRIGLAQALINDPEIVFLDEPTSGLDPSGRKDVKDLIVDLKRQGKTVVMCSHLLAEIEDVCDRIAILSDGELKLLGTVDELLRTRGETQIVAPTLSPEAQAEVEEVLRRHGVSADVSRPKKTLEDLFLRTVDEATARPGRTFSAGDLPGDRPAAGSAGGAARAETVVPPKTPA